MDTMADMMERSDEINDIISRSYDSDPAADEAELEQELELMGDELAMDSVPSYLGPTATPTATATPEASSARPAQGYFPFLVLLSIYLSIYLSLLSLSHF